MDRVKSFIKDKWFYIAAFCVPWIIAILQSFVADTWVTGGGSFLRGDTSMWSVPFYYELWDRVHAGESLIYGWNIAGGYDIWLHILNVAMSPFTILILIFPRTWIVNWVHVMMITHWAGCGVTMTYFFYNTSHNTLLHHKKVVSLFLGLAFTLSNGMINFLGYIQWGMTMVLFPILLLLLERLVHNGKWKLYYACLTLAIVGNFYITFHICLFLILWFFVNINSEQKHNVRRFFLFAWTSVLSAITSAFVIIPSFVISRGRYEGESAVGSIWRMLIDVEELVEQFFILEPIAESYSLRPNVYCSIVAFVLLMLFAFIKINKVKKCYMIFVSLFLTTSILFVGLNMIWHCFTIPNLVYHRFVNVYVFWILFMGLYIMCHMEDLKLRHGVCGFITCVAIFIAVFFNIEVLQNFQVYLITILLLVLYNIILILYMRKSIQYKHLLLTLCVFGVLELSANAYFAFETYTVEVFWDDELVNPQMTLSEKVKLEQGEKVVYLSSFENLGMIANTDAISGFSSYMNSDTSNLFARLGMSSSGKVQYNVRGGSPLINMMFNLKYYIGQYITGASDVEEVAREGKFHLYETKRESSLGYMVDEDIKDWKVSTDIVFENQNEFVNKATGVGDIFTYISPEIICKNYYGLPLVEDERYKEYGVYTVCYSKADAIAKVFMEVEEDMDLYIFYHDDNSPISAVSVNGEVVYRYLSPCSQQTVHVGDVKKDDVVCVEVAPQEGVSPLESSSVSLQFAKFNEATYEEAYNIMSRNLYEVDIMDGDYISGTIHVTEEGIMATSIQAADGFEVFVDDQRVDYVCIGEALIGVPLTKGSHKVEFKYYTPYGVIGFVVSGCGLLLFVLFCYADRKRRFSTRIEK